MSYEIIIQSKAEKQLSKLPEKALLAIDRAITALVETPRPASCKKMKGYENYYRLRVGSYRIIYSVSDGLLQVVVIKVGHRKDIYSGL